MDGPWQIGHMPAREYGLKARDCANQMRMVDPSLQLIACGSSGPGMGTYLEWDRQVLEECYDLVDGISLHCYYRNDAQETGAAGDTSKFLSFNLQMEDQIDEIAGVCDYVRARKRSRKRLWLSFDEWNVWYRQRGGDGRPQAGAAPAGGSVQPRRRAARRRFREFAHAQSGPGPSGVPGAAGERDRADHDEQGRILPPDDLLSVPVGAPVRARRRARSGGRVARHTMCGARARCRISTSPARWTRASGALTLFILNRDLEKPRDVEMVWRETPPQKVVFSQVLTGPDLKAFNSFENPKKVEPQTIRCAEAGSARTDVPGPRPLLHRH